MGLISKFWMVGHTWGFDLFPVTAHDVLHARFDFMAYFNDECSSVYGVSEHEEAVEQVRHLT